jgi:precorrin-2/cobalt-factor-2 C20-methyltransferase
MKAGGTSYRSASTDAVNSNNSNPEDTNLFNVGDKKILAMDFTMDKDPAKRKENYRKNAETAARYLDNDQDVAMVTLGDVSLYSTVHYIADELISRGYEIIMVPGVPSFSAAAASLAIPLAEMDAPVHIIPSVRNNHDDDLDLPGTKVLMKAGRHLHRTLDELDRRGLLDVTSLAVNCGMDDEILIKKLGDDEPLPDKTGYFTTVIVRN